MQQSSIQRQEMVYFCAYIGKYQ